jgi:hypothetical protein
LLRGVRALGNGAGRPEAVSRPEGSATGCPSEPAAGWSSPVIGLHDLLENGRQESGRDRDAAGSWRWQRARVYSFVTESGCGNFRERWVGIAIPVICRLYLKHR